MRKLMLAAGMAVLAIAAAPGAASATTWSGHCEMTGFLHLSPNYHVLPSHHDYELVASGPCTGTLDGRPYEGPAHVYLDGRMGKPMSCFLGFGNGIPGVLTYGADTKAVDVPRLDIVVTEGHVGPNSPFHFTGAYAGHAVGRLTFNVGQEEGEACIGQEGIDRAPIRLETQTIQPIYG